MRVGIRLMLVSGVTSLAGVNPPLAQGVEGAAPRRFAEAWIIGRRALWGTGDLCWPAQEGQTACGRAAIGIGSNRGDEDR